MNPPGSDPAGGLQGPTSDRFLLGILIAIGLLVALSLGLYFIRRGGQRYGPEDTPQGVARNYLLALHNGDYERAYSYLAEGEGKPDLEQFQEAFLTRTLDIANVAVQVGDARTIDAEAVVDLTVIHSGSGPFEDGFRETAVARLKQVEGGTWKITNLPFPYWAWDWYRTDVTKPAF